jgi:2-amino-4-hydroxy-6-hydroxymethyldihydropteridine diphosphokinase
LSLSPVFIALGSNIVPETNLPRAVRLLHDQVGVQRISRVYQSVALDPDGQPLDQPAFLNAAVLLETDLPPVALKLTVLRPLEARLGRIRTADKYAPRPIDLDIALYGDLILEDAAHQITIPDPAITTRAHLALPLADLAPDFRHPLSGETLAGIAARFAHAPGISLHPLALV